ncbi:MAG: hypothetical protein Q8M22_08035 [Actinomycetota bacterium]|nr:hypothetical protein [Actinomycetota bacterium]
MRLLARAAALAVIASSAVVSAPGAPVPSASAAVLPSTPARVLDTRTGVGGVVGPVRGGQLVRFTIPGAVTAGATAVALNVTATGADTNGFVTAWSCDEAKPTTSNLNFVAGRSVPNMVVVRVSQATATRGSVCLESSDDVQLLADAMALFTGTGDVSTITPQRIVDTRITDNPLAANVVRRIRVAGTVGIPADATAAALNVTVVAPKRGGFVSLFPCSAAGGSGWAPSSSTVNFGAYETVASFTTTALSTGDVCAYSSAPTELIVDTFGHLPATGGLRVKDPARVLDTRIGLWSTGAARSGETLRLRVAGRGGVPNESAAAMLTLTVADVGGFGYVTAWSCDGAMPDASVLNFWPGAVRANSALMTLSVATGEICLRAVSNNGTPVSLIADAVGWVPGTLSRPPVPPPPTPSKFTTLPVGSVLPTGAQCATRIRGVAEIRPGNQAYNNTRGTRANTVYTRVDGNFVGTTDEILQWVACKWGIDEDIVRAQIAKESWWNMTAVGDGGESFGLGQVRVPYHGSAFVDDNARRSSAYNVDYTYAVWRSCFEGRETWLNSVERGATYVAGDMKGCLGVWFAGRWYTQPARQYIAEVESYLAQRIWETPDFRNG